MILKLVIIVIAVYLIIKLLKKNAPTAQQKREYARFQQPPAGEDLVEDPVCRTYIPLSEALKLDVEGKTVYFCSRKCRDEYLQRKDDFTRR